MLIVFTYVSFVCIVSLDYLRKLKKITAFELSSKFCFMPHFYNAEVPD